MQLRFKISISVIFLFIGCATCDASGWPEDSRSERPVSIIRSFLVGVKNVPHYPFLVVRQCVEHFETRFPIAPATVSELVELFLITGGY